MLLRIVSKCFHCEWYKMTKVWRFVGLLHLQFTICIGFNDGVYCYADFFLSTAYNFLRWNARVLIKDDSKLTSLALFVIITSSFIVYPDLYRLHVRTILHNWNYPLLALPLFLLSIFCSFFSFVKPLTCKINTKWNIIWKAEEWRE